MSGLYVSEEVVNRSSNIDNDRDISPGLAVNNNEDPKSPKKSWRVSISNNLCFSGLYCSQMPMRYIVNKVTWLSIIKFRILAFNSRVLWSTALISRLERPQYWITYYPSQLENREGQMAQASSLSPVSVMQSYFTDRAEQNSQLPRK